MTGDQGYHTPSGLHCAGVFDTKVLKKIKTDLECFALVITLAFPHSTEYCIHHNRGSVNRNPAGTGLIILMKLGSGRVLS